MSNTTPSPTSLTWIAVDRYQGSTSHRHQFAVVVRDCAYGLPGLAQRALLRDEIAQFRRRGDSLCRGEVLVPETLQCRHEATLGCSDCKVNGCEQSLRSHVGQVVLLTGSTLGQPSLDGEHVLVSGRNPADFGQGTLPGVAFMARLRASDGEPVAAVGNLTDYLGHIIVTPDAIFGGFGVLFRLRRSP